MSNNAPIGFFDSGVGGLSVLKESLKILPNENYIYYGDSINAPYGTKTESDIKRLTELGISFLIKKGVKAIVIACNTATSVAANDLRKKYPNIPILGIEPAIKPAVSKNKNGIILVMATPMTLSKGKFVNMLENYTQYNIKKVPCKGLAELIESGQTSGTIIEDYLKNILSPYINEEIDTIVLGCTHYPFVSNCISSIVGDNVNIIDGSYGTVCNLKKQLENYNILNKSNTNGTLEICNSLNNENMIELSKQLLSS